jgi:gliding motility-associated-like protein
MRQLILLIVVFSYYSLISQPTQTITFNYTGAAQYYTVPACATSLTVTVAGAQGGMNTSPSSPGTNNFGAVVSGVLNVTPGQVLQINVGGQGNCPAGGWNGGGNGGNQGPASGQFLACGGGGASDIRIPPYGLNDRIVVAAGGGGQNGGSSQYIFPGGQGGCAMGSNGASPFGQGGGGGTQTSGGTGGPPWCSPCGQAGFPGGLGVGGNGGDDIQNIFAAGGGGGGGYYGGGGGGADGCCIGANGGGSGGGGSSLVPAGMNCTAGSNAGNGVVIIIAPVCDCSITASHSGNVCTGGTFTLSAVGGTNSATFSWSGPNGFTSNQQNPVINNASISASGVYTVLLTTTNNLTCSATTTLQVVSPGTITIFSADTICPYLNFTLSASNNSTLNVNYNWSGPNGFTSNQQNPVINNVQTSHSGVYSVTTTVTSGTLQCSTTTSSSLYVVPIYTPNVTPSSTICVGDNITFTASANSATSYSWAGPNSFTANTQNINISNAQSNQSGTYTVTAIFTSGNTSCSTYTTTDLSVLPKINFTLSPIPNVCPGEAIVINGPAGASSYTWTNPYGQVVSTNQNLNIPNANFGMSGVYTLSVQPNGGCVSSNSINVTVLTPISFSVTPPDITLCKGDSANVYALCIGGSGVYNYQWYPYTGLYFPAGFANIVKPNQTTYYTIIANDVACPQQTITANFWVNVLPLPTPNFVYDNIKGCRPLCVKLWSNAQPASINTIWDFGYNLYANGDSVRYCFEKPGVYPVKVFLVDSNGCKNTVQAPFSIEVYPRPEPAIYYSPSVATLLHNEIEFTATYNNGPITYWHWDFGDIMTNTDTANTKNAVYTYTYVGNFPVMLIATNIYGCTDTTYRIVPVTEEFTMYIPDAFTPNGDGLNDVFNVKGAGFLEEGFEMRIYDRWGELIFKTNNVYEGWNGKVKGVDAKSDVYIYKIRCYTTVQNIKKEFVGHVTLYR